MCEQVDPPKETRNPCEPGNPAEVIVKVCQQLENRARTGDVYTGLSGYEHLPKHTENCQNSTHVNSVSSKTAKESEQTLHQRLYEEVTGIRVSLGMFKSK